MSSSNSSCLRRLWRRSSEDYSVPCANCPVRRLLAISLPVVPGDRNRARGFQSDPPAGDVAYLARDGERTELLAQDVDPAGLPELQRRRWWNGDPETIPARIFRAPKEGLVVDPQADGPRDRNPGVTTALRHGTHRVSCVGGAWEAWRTHRAVSGHSAVRRTSSVPPGKGLARRGVSGALTTQGGANRKLHRRSADRSPWRRAPAEALWSRSVIYCLRDQTSPDRRRRATGSRSAERLLPPVPPRALVRDRVGARRGRSADR